MKTMVTMIVVTVILCFVAGCGPGQPFEIEGLHTPEPATIQLAADMKALDTQLEHLQ